MENGTITITARRGNAIKVTEGQHFKLINKYGSQVADTWAFNAQDLEEFVSTEHSRSYLEKLTPGIGDSLFSNRRRPMLKHLEDTSPGVHDMLLSACDVERYCLLGCKGYHDNCADNLSTALTEIGLELPKIPSPWNLFENAVVWEGGRLEI